MLSQVQTEPKLEDKLRAHRDSSSTIHAEGIVQELRCEGFGKRSRAGSNTSNVNFPLIEHVMSFRSDQEVKSALLTETGVLYESHVRVVPTMRAERVSGSGSGSVISELFCEVAGLDPAGIRGRRKIRLNHRIGIGSPRLVDRNLCNNAADDGESNDAAAHISISARIDYGTVACIVSVSIRVEAGLNVDQLTRLGLEDTAYFPSAYDTIDKGVSRLERYFINPGRHKTVRNIGDRARIVICKVKSLCS